MQRTEPAVRVEGLGRDFGGLSAVRDIAFEVRRGELFGLVGPDGAGKTTILRMLAGVLRPTRGDAWLVGISVSREPERVKHALAYMSQRFGLYGDLTVRENLDFYADLYEVPRQERAARLERLFAFSSLGPFQDRLAGKLSGGMKQKLGLSCALIHQPEILLLDEPTFGVDPISRRDLWLIVHEMVAQGVTVIASTAYLDEAERFDRVALLHGGRIVAIDAPEALERAEGSLLAIETDRPREAAAALAAMPEIRSVTRFGTRLHVAPATDPATADPAVRRALAAAGLATASVTTIPASLEDVFMARLQAESVS
ncbi:MAG TPA: ABC transporter ATP-binding protein [Gemmatimonadales bacterium]|nr:ABC transporter ATP-binding protein [Gemmatimonadales bacterium]